MATTAHEDAGGAGSGDHGSAATVRGLAVSHGGMKLELAQGALERAVASTLRFRVLEADGQALRDFDVGHERRMHLIVVRRDMTEFQHLHPAMASDGTWSVPITLEEAGSYRVFADFVHEGTPETLASDLNVDGAADYRSLPRSTTVADAGDGYDVTLADARSSAGSETTLGFTVTRDGEPVAIAPYLGAGGHMVSLREGDLAFLHVHPTTEEAPAAGEPIEFATRFPSAGSYRLFLQFRVGDEVHTAAFTQDVTR